MSRASGDRYLLEIEKGGQKQRLVWDSARPMPVSFPVKWVAEKSGDKIRFRNLSPAKLGQAYSDGFIEIGEPGRAPVLVEGKGLKLRLSKLRAAAPLYASANAADGELVAYACSRESILATIRPDADGSVRFGGGASSFRVRATAAGYAIESQMAGVLVRFRDEAGAERAALDVGRSLEIPSSRLNAVEITAGRHVWRLGRVRAVAFEAARAEVLDPADAWFRKQLQRTGIGLAVVALALVLWPSGSKPVHSPDEQIIPEQYAKILMKPQAVKPTETVEARTGGGGSPEAGGTAAGQKVEGKAPVQASKASQTAVARAFRAQALQNSVRGLVKGGMTTFLAQGGTLLLGSDSSNQAKKIFDGAADTGVMPASPDAGYARGPNVEVGVGGGGFGGKGGTERGVGYGSGKRAGVGGQGGAFVSLDLPGSSVADGLSKDEVGKVIHAHMAEVRYCYESSMIRNPDLAGKLVLDFTIGPQGSVTSASVKESSLLDPRLDDCILRRLTKWAFPKPKGNVSVAVSYPFIFKALQR